MPSMNNNVRLLLSIKQRTELTHLALRYVRSVNMVEPVDRQLDARKWEIALLANTICELARMRSRMSNLEVRNCEEKLMA